MTHRRRFRLPGAYKSSTGHKRPPGMARGAGAAAIATTIGLAQLTALTSLTPVAAADTLSADDLPAELRCSTALADMPQPATSQPARSVGDYFPTLPAAHRLATGRGVTVAVIDTGVRPTAELPQLRDGGDLIGEADGLTDCDLHGTIVAELIAARGLSSPRMRGVAPDAEILSLRGASRIVAKSSTAAPGIAAGPQALRMGNSRNLALAINKAIDQGADVINLSLSLCLGPDEIPTENWALAQAIERAEAQNVVVVAAAGNRGPECEENDVAYPAHFPTVIAVGAMDDSHTAADYTMHPATVTAPGGPYQVPNLNAATPGSPVRATGSVIRGVHSPAHPQQPVALQGTSFAAPVVTGVVALIVERNPQATARQVREVLQRSSTATATDLGPWVDPFAAASVIISSPRGEESSFLIASAKRQRSPVSGSSTRGPLFVDEGSGRSQLASDDMRGVSSVAAIATFVALPLLGVVGALGIVFATSVRCRRRRR